MNSPRDQFDRKVCSCAKCCVGCRTMPGTLVPHDVERIADHLGIVGDAIYGFVKDNFCAGYSVVGIRTIEGYVPKLVPTVSPQQRSDGTCVFLGPDYKCKVHPVAPFACSHFDHHMPAKEADKRSLAQLQACNSSEGYRNLHQMLIEDGIVARKLSERKAAFAAELVKVERKENGPRKAD